MKRKLWLAAVAGLVACGTGAAQDGRLAPTAPIVPAPVLANGAVRAPAAGTWGNGGGRLFASNWSPLRSPVTAGASALPTGSAGGIVVPPPPPGVPVGPAGCEPGCAPGRDRSCWTKMKAWLGYAPSKSDLPKLNPTPYTTPLYGMFPCAPAGCATCAGAVPAAAPGAPAQPPQPPMMTPPVPPKVAGAVTLPPRGAPAPAAATASKPLPGTVVPAGFKVKVPPLPK